MVNHPSIKAVKSTFGKVRCAQITWQILEETQQFFGMRLGPNDFTNGGPGLYPTVELGGLIEDVRRNRPLESVTLPRQWKFQENAFVVAIWRWGKAAIITTMRLVGISTGRRVGIPSRHQ